jgi:hypothetical protein
MSDLPKELEDVVNQSKPKRKRKRKCAPEKDVRKEISVQMVEAFPGCWHFKPVQSMLGAHGIPDDLFCVKVRITQDMVGTDQGMFVALEAKAEDGKVRGTQIAQITKIKEAGGVAGIVRGVDAVKKMIDHLKRKWL